MKKKITADHPLVSSLSSLCKSGSGLLTPELTVRRWECPGIPLIPFIPSTVMSGHVFSLNRNRDGTGGESRDMTRSAIYVFCMVNFRALALQLPLISDWE